MVAELVSLDEVRAAARRLTGVVVRTPLIPFAAEDANLLIKPESLQPTGAFKLRGAYNAISALPAAAKAIGVVAHSSGNHGFAVAYAAALLNVRAAIVVPGNAPRVKTDAIVRTGAELVRVEPTQAASTRAAIVGSTRTSSAPARAIASVFTRGALSGTTIAALTLSSAAA